MVEKSKLYIEVRELLDTAKPDSEVIDMLKNRGHLEEDIAEAIKEYHKDEKTFDDDKLIREIEKRFHKGEDMQSIIASLVSQGHTQFEVEKAVLRADLKG